MYEILHSNVDQIVYITVIFQILKPKDGGSDKTKQADYCQYYVKYPGMRADIGNLFEQDCLITETNCTFFRGKVHL